MPDPPPFSVLPHLKDRFTAVGRKLAYDASTPADHRAWRGRTRRALKRLVGYGTFERTDPNPRVTETTEADGLLRRRIEIDTEPGVTMPLVELRRADAPGTRQDPLVPVICAHGHASGGKLSTTGRRDVAGIAAQVETYNYDYGVQLARAGWITFCPDARGFGERREAAAMHDVLASSCQWINQMALPLGQTVTGMWAWDLHRLVDWLETREDVRADRVACVGLSGGGLQTLWAAALDTRIRAAVVSGYFYGVEQALLEKHTNCSCNYVPGLWEHVDMGDIGACIAPRPLMIETGDADPLNGREGVTNVRRQVAVTRRAYRALDASRNVYHRVFAGEHRWEGTKVPEFLERHVGR